MKVFNQKDKQWVDGFFEGEHSEQERQNLMWTRIQQLIDRLGRMTDGEFQKWLNK